MNEYPPLELVVWGELACFTRPEAKVERVSYPVMTPSAARGVLEAILWRPEFAWHVREIHVLRPIRWQSLLRNEINSRQSERSDVVKKGGHYLADEDRAQRHSLLLRDVRYRILADIVLRDHGRLDPNQEPPNLPKYRDQFHRRVQAGRCFQQPYLGCREFVAQFGARESPGDDTPLPLGQDLGQMLFDLRFRHDEQGRGIGGEPLFFAARLEHGVLRVPQEKYAELEAEVAPCC